MSATTALRITGYHVDSPDENAIGPFSDAYGNIWFTAEIARIHAVRLRTMYRKSTRNTVKPVVIKYSPKDPSLSKMI